MKRRNKNDSPRGSKESAPQHNPIQSRRRASAIVRELVKPGKAEGQRIELKRELAFEPAKRRAEFIKDVLSLANSEGEHPRESAYLIIGVKDGQFFDTSLFNLDGATIGQIIDAHVVPPLKYTHCSVFIKKGVRTDVIEFEPDSNVLYIVKRDLRDESQRSLLCAGQTWGRRADRKMQLIGDDILRLLHAIQTRLCDLAVSPFREQVSELQQTLAKAGPENDVRRILYAMEKCQGDKDWEHLKSLCWALSPYIRDFGKTISQLVLDGLSPFTDVRDGTPLATVDAILNIMFSCLPMYSFRHKAPRNISPSDEEFYSRGAEFAWEIAYDAIKYAGNLEVTESACQTLADIGKVATLNEVSDLMHSIADHFTDLRKLCEGWDDERFLAIVAYFEAEGRLENPKRPDFMK